MLRLAPLWLGVVLTIIVTAWVLIENCVSRCDHFYGEAAECAALKVIRSGQCTCLTAENQEEHPPPLPKPLQ